MTAPTIGSDSFITGDVMALRDTDPPISIEDMLERGKVMTLDDARLVLGTTEPITFRDFETGESVDFRVEDGWNEDIKEIHGTEPVEVYMSVSHGQNSSTEYQLTLDAVHQAAGMFSMGRGLVERNPSFLTEQMLRWWFRTGLESDLRLMLRGENHLGVALTKDTVEPFSNLALLDAVLARIENRYPGTRVFVDRNKMSHSLDATFLQLVLPDVAREMVDTGEVLDNWWGGVQLTNSFTAKKQTAAQGFLFRQRCTNGMIDVAPSDLDVTWNRRQGGQEMDDVLAWAQSTVDEILGRFGHTFDLIQGTVTQVVGEDGLDVTVEDIFNRYRIPVPRRKQILDNLEGAPQPLTTYHLINAITQAANGDVVTSQQQVVMSAGGDFAHHAARCDSCHRYLPGGED